MVPERQFAVIVLTNCGPNGEQLNSELVKWALEAYLGVVEAEPDVIDAPEELLADYAGEYDSIALAAHISPHEGGLLVKLSVKPEVLAEIGEIDQYDEPIPLGLIAGDGPEPTDRYVVTGGAMHGMRGYFSRDAERRVDSINLGGRRCDRVV
jgi:hypothetical protein